MCRGLYHAGSAGRRPAAGRYGARGMRMRPSAPGANVGGGVRHGAAARVEHPGGVAGVGRDHVAGFDGDRAFRAPSPYAIERLQGADPVVRGRLPQSVRDAAVARQDGIDVERFGQHVHAQDGAVLGGPVAAVGPRRQHVLGAAAQAGGVELRVRVERVLRRHPRFRLVVGVEPAPLVFGERALHALVQQRAGALEPLGIAGVAPQPQEIGGALGVHQVVGRVLDVDRGAAHRAVVPAAERQVAQPVGAGVVVVLPGAEPARRRLPPPPASAGRRWLRTGRCGRPAARVPGACRCCRSPSRSRRRP